MYSHIHINMKSNVSTCLVDDKLDIRITGLMKTQAVTVAAFLEEDCIRFVSHGFYVTDEEGRATVIS